ncbi:hypothetical protein B0T26DRAFT_787560 [Lasiosphaeria miniovina]|uniref:Uncharacterized protein n=1 Tax=Lasiosphaeria miniovina TaxID=1954250 RepID=A0AA40DNH3_9PEZI|nr:uncharacterized protein B0T26DRAFT_787560 [Lasiosphaeria miniovina]KAK0710209.1 hypothetical protein B0T26DRAFT_787560 [Lasiosphaeria miniovina]
MPGTSHPFPITAKQLVYLVAHSYIETPTTQEDEINDKSTADSITKCLVLFQSSRLITVLITRAACGLQITPFELTTAALISCSTVTLCLWWHKPLDVMTPTSIHAKCHIHELLDRVTHLCNRPTLQFFPHTANFLLSTFHHQQLPQYWSE